MAWGWETFQQMSIFGWTIPVFNAMHLLCSFKCNIVFLWRLRNVQGITVQKEEKGFAARNTALIVEEEIQFQKYATQVIETARKSERNTFPLLKAARDGIGGGLGPVFGGLRPSYLVHDESGVEMPSYVSGTTQNIKELNETPDIQQSKKRLGFSS